MGRGHGERGEAEGISVGEGEGRRKGVGEGRGEGWRKGRWRGDKIGRWGKGSGGQRGLECLVDMRAFRGVGALVLASLMKSLSVELLLTLWVPADGGAAACLVCLLQHF